MKTHTLPYYSDSTLYYPILQAFPWPIWLDSQSAGRYDILTAAPFMQLTVIDDRLTVVDTASQTTQVITEDPFTYLQDILSQYAIDATHDAHDVPFAGGALGFWGYELLQHELPPNQGERVAEIPDMAVGLYDWAIVVDHHSHLAQLVSHAQHHTTTSIWDKLVKTLQQADDVLPDKGFKAQLNSVNMDFATYRERFKKVREYLYGGDCYQINMAKRWHFNFSGSSFSAYCHLRPKTKVRYGAYLDYGHFQVLSCSPECFLTKRGAQVLTQPIKGTMPRGKTPTEDAHYLACLQSSQKDRAENLMIVDLLRNDLSRVCQPGSVKVEKLFDCVTYPTVHHMVSEVSGQLRAGIDATTLLRHCFPGGSITGAPKKHVRELIQTLEPHQRHVYCGSVGYIGFDGQMDTNIAIRTLLCTRNHLYAWAGGGIVADSQAELEWQETEAKLDKMIRALNA